MIPGKNTVREPFRLFHSDNMAILQTLDENSIDSIVTDPPYGLGKEPDAMNMLRDWLDSGHHDVKGSEFMGQAWDAFVPQPVLWSECLRVLKPGGHLLSFGGTRTYDMVVLGLRIAGFEIRDQIAWVYSQGMPKSKNLGDGWGTTLKPAMEPIVVARKPLFGTATQTFKTFRTGGLNIDACRITSNGGRIRTGEASQDRIYTKTGVTNFSRTPGPRGGDPRGRFPANFVHDGSEAVLTCFPETKKGGSLTKKYAKTKGVCYGQYGASEVFESYGDEGSAARFFYCAKATRQDRNEGLADPGPQFTHGATLRKVQNTSTAGNTHPTVKPTDLMRWLCRLVTPEGGLVLDPFMGSGSTGKAALEEGFRFIGIENNAEYFAIASGRLAHVLSESVVKPLPFTPGLHQASD